MNITYKSSENSNLDTFYCFRIYNIFKYLDCDSTYIMLVIYYCSILYKSLVWVLIIREWMRSAIWKNACDRNQKKISQINVEFLLVIVFILLLIFWSFIDRRRNMISILLPWTGWILLMAFPLPHHFT